MTGSKRTSDDGVAHGGDRNVLYNGVVRDQGLTRGRWLDDQQGDHKRVQGLDEIAWECCGFRLAGVRRTSWTCHGRPATMAGGNLERRD
ncbi:hypothetical protein NL676_007641 [Syzygium grande]|nr:hypothetical protein NL676_007641 [Syzygium grande]